MAKRSPIVAYLDLAEPLVVDVRPRRAVLSIDPSYAEKGEGCACVVHIGGVCVKWWFERPEQWGGPYRRDLTHVIYERPQSDSRAASAATLIRLTACGAELAGLYAGAHGAKLVALTPTESKGNVSKPIAHGKLWKTLSLEERTLLGGAETERQIRAAKLKGARDCWRKKGADYYPKKWLMHNILDAADLGRGYE